MKINIGLYIYRCSTFLSSKVWSLSSVLVNCSCSSMSCDWRVTFFSWLREALRSSTSRRAAAMPSAVVWCTESRHTSVMRSVTKVSSRSNSYLFSEFSSSIALAWSLTLARSDFKREITWSLSLSRPRTMFCVRMLRSASCLSRIETSSCGSEVLCTWRFVVGRVLGSGNIERSNSYAVSYPGGGGNSTREKY